MKYAFIKANRAMFSVQAMCRVLKIHRSGFYAWQKVPLSKRAKEDHRLSGLIKQAWLESGCVYGYRKLHADLCYLGERCGSNRVLRLARLAGIKAQIGYGKRPGKYGGKPSVVAVNRLEQSFGVCQAPEIRSTF